MRGFGTAYLIVHDRVVPKACFCVHIGILNYRCNLSSRNLLRHGARKSSTMASTSPALIVVAIALVIIYLSRKLFKPQKLNLPPGPTPLPIIGSMHLIGPSVHRSLADLAQKYGPVMSLRLGQNLCIVATSAEAAKEFLKVQDANFASRPTVRAAELLLPDDLLFSDLTPVFRHLRKIFVTELTSPKRLQASKYIRTEEVAYMLRTISKETGPVQLRTYVNVMVANILSRMILNKRFLGQEGQAGQDVRDEIQEFIDIVEGLEHCFGANHLQDVFHFIPKWLDLQGLDARFRKLRARMDLFYENIVRQHKENRRKNPISEDEKTLLDVLLEQLDSGEHGITQAHVNGVIWDAFAAGTGTTILFSEWAMAETLRNPIIMKKVRSEIDDVVGFDRMVQESDIPKLKYTQAIVKEALRLHPVTPLLVPHQSINNTKVFGYDIPAKTRLIVNYWGISRDPELWKKPLEFVPERFLESPADTSMEFRDQHFEYIPFGAGRRLCPGMPLALIEVPLLVASLLHAFEWSFPNGLAPEKLDMTDGHEKFNLEMQHPLVALAKPRLPSHLY